MVHVLGRIMVFAWPDALPSHHEVSADTYFCRGTYATTMQSWSPSLRGAYFPTWQPSMRRKAG